MGCRIKLYYTQNIRVPRYRAGWLKFWPRLFDWTFRLNFFHVEIEKNRYITGNRTPYLRFLNFTFCSEWTWSLFEWHGLTHLQLEQINLQSNINHDSWSICFVNELKSFAKPKCKTPGKMIQSMYEWQFTVQKSMKISSKAFITEISWDHCEFIRIARVIC